MTYLKFSADYLFTGNEMLGDDAVLITKANGEIIAIENKANVNEDVRVFQGILTPGFVNAHCHLELSHLKNAVPENKGMVDFLLDVMMKRNHEQSIIDEAIVSGEKEMLDNGIVAVGDICNTVNTITKKKNSTLHYHNFIEATGFLDANANERFDIYQKIKETFLENDLQHTSITPHAPYSVSKSLFQNIFNSNSGQPLTIHNQESDAENIFFKTGEGDFLKLFNTLKIDISSFKPTGKSSLQSYFPQVTNHQSLILVHNLFTNEEDINFAKEQAVKADLDLYWCLCSNANLYISNLLPDINLFIKNDCKIVTGTDSLASNHQLNILEELKTISKNFPDIELPTLLKWATINGAAALKIENIFGSFEKGKKPGVVLIENINGQKLTCDSVSKRIL